MTVGDETTGAINPGYVLFVGATHTDTPEIARSLAEKVANLRVLDDADGIMNRSALDYLADDPSSIGMLVVSQFTLYGDVRKGRRPSWVGAAPGPISEPLVDAFAEGLRGFGVPVETGLFGAEMLVELVNDGPVTIWLDSDELQKPRRG